MGRLRQIFESIVYAGLKPAGAPAPPPGTGWRGRLRRAWDRFLSGGAPSDPLYLSNRTWKQKLKVAAAVSTPVLIVVGIFVYSLVTPPPAPEKPLVVLTPAEIAARTQIIPKDFKVPQNVDVQVGEVSVDRASTPHRISGTLQNVSEKRFSNVELTFDLTDENGSQVGGARTVVPDIGPHATKSFNFAIPQRNAAFVLVRETRPVF